ncbi:MAG: TonB-dependent receptor [Halioglobus sp.]
MTNFNPKIKLLAASIVAAVVSTNASAQLEEVIVTAQKRAESLGDTAIAITAINGDMLDDLNVTSASDYEAIVPSLSVRNEPRRLFIRGVGRVTNSLGSEPGIAVYNDQIYTSEIGVLSRAGSLTTKQVEILRGPQGTLFGRNTTGGAVSVSSLRPTEDFQHHVRAKAGNYGELNWGASSSGPITDALRYRVYAYNNKHDGYIENLGGKDIQSKDHTGQGAQLSWDVSDTLNIWLSYQKDETDDVRSGVQFGGYLISPYRTDLLTQDDFLLAEQYQWGKENPSVTDPRKVDMGDVLRAKTDNNNRITTHVTWDLDAVTVKYIGNYTESDYEAVNGDLGGTSNPDVRILEGTENLTESYSHEIQFISASEGPLQWVAGLYYYNEELHQPYFISTPQADNLQNVLPSGSFDPSLIVPNTGFPEQYRQLGELESETTAVYIDGNYAFNDQWKLTAGLRYSYDEKKGYEEQFAVADPAALGLDLSIFPGFPDEGCCGWSFLDPSVDNRKLEDDWDNVSGRVVLDYMPVDEHLFYGSVSTGYKAGGFSLGTLAEVPSFDEEEVLSYEVGYKGTFNEVLRVNAAAYFYDYSDMQVFVTRLTDQNLPVSAVTNADEAEVKGLEVETVWLATENLTLMANYSYIDGEYTDFCCFTNQLGEPELGNQDLSGNPLTQAPENKVFMNASYSLQTASVGEFVFSGSYTWVDERQYSVFDEDVTRAEDYYRVDAMLSWYSPQQNIRVILSGKNLTEEDNFSHLTRITRDGGINGQINEPRVYGLEVQFDF